MGLNPDADAQTLQDMVNAHLIDDDVDARNVTAATNAITIGDLRVGNNSKAKLVAWGVGIQVAATFVLICALLWQLKPLVFS